MKVTRILGALALIVLTLGSARAEPITKAQVLKLLKHADDVERTAGDVRAVGYMLDRQRGKSDMISQVVYLRRTGLDALVLMWQKPRSVRGRGYLLIKDNLWSYDARAGKWDRATMRAKLAGSSATQADFLPLHLGKYFIPKLLGTKKLGSNKTIVLDLYAKKNSPSIYSRLRVWIDLKTGLLLKRQDMTPRGKKLRTVYYPKWAKTYSKSKKGMIWYPQKVLIFDELIKGNSTQITTNRFYTTKLAPNTFTKAWFEGQSR